MNLVDFCSHRVDLDAIPENPVVLDVGCRGFGFCKDMFRHRPNARIYAMDPDPNMSIDDKPTGVTFIREALVGDDRRSATYAGWSDGEGNLLCTKVPWYASFSCKVPCVNITSLMQQLSIGYWDVIKLDCEESEFQILENWPGPIAGVLSVEFHDWTGEWKQKCNNGDTRYYDALFGGPLKDYDVLTHELSTVGPGPAWGHWDSVLRLKRLAV